MYKILTIVLLLLAIISCKDNNFDNYFIGDDFVKSETTIAIVDTFDVNLSTFIVDSMVTSGTSTALVGNYTDEELGIVRAKSYFQVGLNENSYIIDDKDKFDSLTIKLRYTGLAYGDTLVPVNINIYRLTEELKAGDSGNLFNTSSFNHESSPIGSITFKPEPNNDRNLEIKLDGAWGQELLDKIKNDAFKSDEYESKTDKFLKYLPGFVIDSKTDNGSVLSFQLADSLLQMTIYTHRFDEDFVYSKLTFPFTNSSLQFNEVSSDRTGTYAETLTNNSRNNIPSDLTGNRSFSQAGIGMFTKIEFPGLPRLLEMNSKRLLLKAELILYPVFRSYEKVELPKKLYFYETNKLNDILDVLMKSEDEVLAADLYYDDVYFENTYYKIEITDFISNEFADGFYNTEHALLANISTAKMGSSLDRIIFSDGTKKAQFRPILKLYYVFYN